MTGYTEFSPIWSNGTYLEIAKLQHVALWKWYGVLYIRHIFHKGVLLSFEALQELFGLPSSMRFYYMQLRHAVTAQYRSSKWSPSPTPLFNLIKRTSTTKGFISQCYSMLLQNFQKKHPLRMLDKWEGDVGRMDGDQWEEALQAMPICSLNVSQRLTQLYIILRVYYTPHRMYIMGLRPTLLCTRCKRDHGDLIHLLWRCPKIHSYWKGVVDTINRIF